MSTPILLESTNYQWAPGSTTVGTTYILPELPVNEPVTSAFALAFTRDGRMLVTNLPRRNRDIPGGKLEENETAEDAARRETYEETGASLGALTLIAGERLIDDPPIPNPRYPRPGWQVFFAGRLLRLGDLPESEALGREVISLDDARAMSWTQEHPALLELAVAHQFGIERSHIRDLAPGTIQSAAVVQILGFASAHATNRYDK